MKLSDDYLRTLKDRLIASGVVGKTVHWRGEDNTITGFSQRWNDFGVQAKTSEGRAVWIPTATAYAALIGNGEI